MQNKYFEKFKKDLAEFHEMTKKFYRKEITVPEYKSFSGGFGSYAQRGGEKSMLRLRLAGGEIDTEQIKFIADSIEKYDIDLLHLTTCQTVQLHNLTEKTVCNLIEEAWEHGIITRGGGGDFPRNVMCSPLSGVEQDEAFDVLPYAKAAGDYLLSFIGEVKLPRKLKVCFSSNAKNEPHATFRDMGFVAKDNQKFDLYIAGGLGIKPKFGVKVAEDVEPSEILYCIKTMVDIFTKYGNYESRAASRTRFLQDTLGSEQLKEIFTTTLAENKNKEDLDLHLSSSPITKKSTASSEEALTEELLKNDRIIPQKQDGLYAVAYVPVGGRVRSDFFGTLYKTISNMEDVKIRLTPTQSMYIINLTAREAKEILEITTDSADSIFACSTACIGADICQQGIGLSQALLRACVDRIQQENLPKDALPEIHISGCPSSCSAHQTASIGLRGGKKPSPEGPKFAFAVYDNGCDLQGQESFGTELGVMYEEQIPDFFAELGHAVADTGLSYKEFRQTYPEKISEIAKKYI